MCILPAACERATNTVVAVYASKKGVKLLAGVQSGRENAFLMTLLRQLYLDVTTPVQGNT